MDRIDHEAFINWYKSYFFDDFRETDEDYDLKVCWEAALEYAERTWIVDTKRGDHD